MSRVERWWEKDGLFWCELACRLIDRAKNRSDSVVVEISRSSQIVEDEDKFHWPFGRCELHGLVVRLFVSGYESHVSGWNANEGGHVGVASEVHGESSHTGSTMITRNGAFVCSDEARAWRTAFIMSSGSYSGFAMQEFVHL